MTNAGFWGALDSVGFQATRVLMTLLWQSSLVLLAAGGLAWLLRRRQAAVRHLVWVTALVAAPVLPLAAWLGGTVGVPQAKIPVMPAYTVEPAAMPLMPAPSPVPAMEVPPLPVRPLPPEPVFTLSDYPWALALMAYASGAMLFLFLVLLGRYRISRWIAGGSVVTDERVLGAFGEAGRQLGLNRRPLIVATAVVQAPVTIGGLRAAVLLPEEFEAGLPDADLRAIALHESAHIRRRDPLVLSLASLLRALLFFHPLVWLACRQVSLLAEQAADDAVLDITGEPVAYARMLARLAEELRRRSLTTELAAGIVLSKSAFLRRVEAILSDRSDSLRRLSRRALALTILAALLSLFLASALPLSEKKPLPTKEESAAGAEEATLASNATEVNLERLVEAIRQREARVRTLQYVWSSKEFIPKGSMTVGDPATAPPMPPEDTETEQTYTMWIEGALVRIEQRGHILDENTGEFGPYEDTTVLGADGVERELWQSAKMKSSGLVGPLRQIPAGIWYQAVLQAYRLTDPVLGRVSSSEARFVTRGEQQGHPCIVIERQFKLPNSSWVHRWWLAEDMEYSVLRWEDNRESGEPIVGLDMNYAPDQQMGWRLTSWSLTTWSGPQSEPGTRTNVATEVHINGVIAPETFSITFPPGTKVSDRFGSRVYVVGERPETYPAPVEGSMSFAERVLRVKLQWRLPFHFTDAPLAYLLNLIRAVVGIDFALDPQLQAEQDKLKVTLSMKDSSTEEALDSITSALNLQWSVRDGSVHISPKNPQGSQASGGREVNLAEVDTKALAQAAWETNRRLRGADVDLSNIPEEFWAEPIRQLHPVRVYQRQLNMVIVLRETEEFEEGLYVSNPISSYFPASGHGSGFLFTPITRQVSPDGSFWSFMPVFSFKRARTRQAAMLLEEEFAAQVKRERAERAAKERPVLETGNAAPELTLEEGAGVTLAQFRGKPVVLAFVSIYSRPCVKVLDELKALQEKQAADKLAVVGVHDRTATLDEIEQFRKDHSIPFPILRVPDAPRDGWDSATFRAYGVTALPTVVRIDPEGKVESVGDGSTLRQQAGLSDHFAAELARLKRQFVPQTGRDALVSGYEKLIAEHPGHPLAPQAMLDIGHLYADIEIPELGIEPDPDRGLAWFQRAASAAPVGSEAWTEANFSVAGFLRWSDPNAAVRLLEKVRDAAAKTDVLTHARVEAELQGVCHSLGDLAGAERHCRELLGWYRDPKRIPTDDLVKSELDSIINGAGSLMVTSLAHARLPAAERAWWIRQLMNDFVGLTSLQLEGERTLKELRSRVEREGVR